MFELEENYKLIYHELLVKLQQLFSHDLYAVGSEVFGVYISNSEEFLLR
jgi:hypothetical protein